MVNRLLAAPTYSALNGCSVPVDWWGCCLVGLSSSKTCNVAFPPTLQISLTCFRKDSLSSNPAIPTSEAREARSCATLWAMLNFWCCERTDFTHSLAMVDTWYTVYRCSSQLWDVNHTKHTHKNTEPLGDRKLYLCKHCQTVAYYRMLNSPCRRLLQVFFAGIAVQKCRCLYIYLSLQLFMLASTIPGQYSKEISIQGDLGTSWSHSRGIKLICSLKKVMVNNSHYLLAIHCS